MCNKVDESQNNYAECKNPDTNEDITCDSIYIKSWKIQKADR